MSRLLLREALEQIAPQALPAAENQQVNSINRVVETFFSVGKWEGTTLRWNGTTATASFAIFQDANRNWVITLPRHVQTILMGATGVGEGPCMSNVPVRGPWWAFNAGGPPAGDRIRTGGLIDAGDGYTTFRDFTDVSYLRVKTDGAEADPTEILFRGLDENGKEIYTGSGNNTYQGVKLDIGDATTTTTTQKFSAAPTIIQKPTTRRPIQLFAVKVSDSTETLIGEYAAGETNPSYRRYMVAGCSTDFRSVQAFVKRRFVPAEVDADEIIPGNVSAIELGLQGRRYDLENDPAAALTYWNRAFSLLNASLGEYRGGVSPRIQFEASTFIGRIPRIA